MGYVVGRKERKREEARREDEAKLPQVPHS